MATVLDDIIVPALKKSGIVGQGRAPSAAEANDALGDLNDMLAQWNTERFMIFSLLDLAFTSTGANSYTVGPAGNFAVSPRPDRLEFAYQRQTSTGNLPVDTPMEIIPSREEYSRITLKTLSSFGLYVFLDTTFPSATLYVYPSPNASIYEIHIGLKNVMPVFALDTDIGSLPPHYVPCMKFPLARILRQAYGKGMKPDPELNRLSNKAIDVVRNSNLQIPELVMPRVLLGQSSGYNILSDQFGNG